MRFLPRIILTTIPFGNEEPYFYASPVARFPSRRTETVSITENTEQPQAKRAKGKTHGAQQPHVIRGMRIASTHR